ncbi:tetratricopeptide repeat protein [Pelagicoccus sp. NFK12]|uniref:Tetratricopeptide repeat protein n=1 Tax=Pelagicoccus enzymogenes TaxID=2773457 RepID=A0A927FC34_9BACT|nr:tetratricopeptide repeat protein [Pelagicoccus enzymogenes]MBD5781041.1 tetratricopeptide repeat protein [Pelagicoccus enzymogenes]
MRNLLSAFFVLSLLGAAASQAQVGKPSLSRSDFDARVEEGYNSVLSPEPEVTVLERELLKKIYSLLDTDVQFAYTFLQDTLNSGNPVSGAFNHAMGNVYFKNGNYFQAETQYLAAIDKHPTFQRAWNALGLARYQQGDYEGAATALANSVRYGANDAMSYGILGFCHLQLGRYRSAETAYHYAMLFEPEQTDWAEGIAQVYNETARFEEAISVFDDLIRTDPSNNEFWLLKANAWLELGEPMKTARCIEIAKRIGDVDTDTLYLLGNLYLEAGIFNRAREVFISAAESSGELNEQDLIGAIRYLVFQEKHEFAEEIFQLLKGEGDDWSREDKKLYRFLKAEFAYFHGELDASEEAYASGLELEPFNGYALMKMASIKLNQGDVERSIVYFDRAAANPAFRYDALVSKAMALINNKQYRLALKPIEQALVERSDARLTQLHAQVQRVVESNELTAPR